jgi:hypothetical protein
MITAAELSLLHGYLNGCFSEADLVELQKLLRENEEARAMLRTLSTVETRLSELGAEKAIFEPLEPCKKEAPAHGPRGRFSLWRTWIPAAAGLVVGLFSASMLFAFVTTAGGGKVVSLLQEDFEEGNPPLAKGLPTTPGNWSGDFSRIVGSQQGVSPRTGRKMLQFLRADYEGKPSQFSYSGDLYRLLDLRGYEADLRDGKAMVTVEATFQGVPVQIPAEYSFNVQVNALDAPPADGFLDHKRQSSGGLPKNSEEAGDAFIPASAQRSFKIASNGAGWEKARVELRIPPGAKFLLLSFHVVDTCAGREGRRVHGDTVREFPGQFVDDIQTSLICNVPLR